MICQSCGKNQATTHIKTIVNGELKEYMLCPECAQKMGYAPFFGGMGLNLENFLGSFLGENGSFAGAQSQQAVRCKKCGSSFADIARSGKMGCAECYTTFYDKLLPSIQRIHGNTAHCGKVVGSAGLRAKRASELEMLRSQLNEAVRQQEFEQAARLRDQIKELEGGQENG